MKLIISRPVFEHYKKQIPNLKEGDFYISENLQANSNKKTA